jgi:hypothetical protein
MNSAIPPWDGLLCSLTNNTTTIFNKAPCLLADGQLGFLPTLILFNHLSSFSLLSGGVKELDGNIYPTAAAHLRAQSFIVP